jgi:murein DD-endopeptidase MepM/ murein hydrolase activator NlpD
VTFDSHARRAAPKRISALLAGVMAASSIGAGVAFAQGGATIQSGGTTAPGDPQISDVLCVTNCIKARVGTVGSKFRIIGTDLSQTTVVSLPKPDGKRAKDKAPVVKPSGAVTAFVKPGAMTGPTRIADTFGQIRDSITVFKVGTEEQLRQAQTKWRFPVRGKHTYGDGIGAPRNGHTHQGQDIFAACGTKLVAARGGKVQARAYHGSAGHYVVIDGAKSKHDFVYMHLKGPARVAKGQTVTTGQKLGKVGESGNASGCHLHFEMWSPPGWYEGGHFVNPTKHLKYWDSFS